MKVRVKPIVALLAAGVAGLGYIAFAPADATSPATTVALDASLQSDPREAVVLTAEQHQFALRQMRGLLVTIRELDAAEAVGDSDEMVRLAGEQGPGAGKVKHPRGFHEALPSGFRTMSQAMRKSFGAMAADLAAGDRVGYRARRIEALDGCIGCHETYRFQPEVR